MLSSNSHYSKDTFSQHVLSRMCYRLSSHTLGTVKLHTVQMMSHHNEERENDMKKRYKLPVSGTVYRLRYLQVCVHESRSRDDPQNSCEL